jgi:large subunit ribosomal protein L9
MAILATQGALRQVDDLKRAEQRRLDRVRHDVTQQAGRINGLRLPFTARVGETGRLYGSITTSDIAAAIEARLGEPIDRRKILLDEPIRTLGEHDVPIHLMPGVDAAVIVEVLPDAESAVHLGRAGFAEPGGPEPGEEMAVAEPEAEVSPGAGEDEPAAGVADDAPALSEPEAGDEPA